MSGDATPIRRLAAGDARDLYALTAPVNPALVKDAPEGKYGEYIPHHVLNQMVLAAIGPFNWELVEILRGVVPATVTSSGQEYDEMPNAIIGCVYRFTGVVDGRTVSIEEAGSCEALAYENNDAERLKKAASDAFKRCVMRLGVGIQLWCDSDEQYLIHKSLQFYQSQHDAAHG